MTGDAELANEEDVERCAECSGDLVRDRDASPGQSQHDDVIPAPIVLQQAGKGPTGLVPVPEVGEERNEKWPYKLREAAHDR